MVSSIHKRLQDQENYIKAAVNHISYEKYEKGKFAIELAPEVLVENERLHRESLKR